MSHLCSDRFSILGRRTHILMVISMCISKSCESCKRRQERLHESTNQSSVCVHCLHNLYASFRFRQVNLMGELRKEPFFSSTEFIKIPMVSGFLKLLPNLIQLNFLAHDIVHFRSFSAHCRKDTKRISNVYSIGCSDTIFLE